MERVDLHDIRQSLLGIITTDIPEDQEELADKLYEIVFRIEAEEAKLYQIKTAAKDALKNLS